MCFRRAGIPTQSVVLGRLFCLELCGCCFCHALSRKPSPSIGACQRVAQQPLPASIPWRVLPTRDAAAPPGRLGERGIHLAVQLPTALGSLWGSPGSNGGAHEDGPAVLASVPYMGDLGLAASWREAHHPRGRSPMARAVVEWPCAICARASTRGQRCTRRRTGMKKSMLFLMALLFGATLAVAQQTPPQPVIAATPGSCRRLSRMTMRAYWATISISLAM